MADVQPINAICYDYPPDVDMLPAVAPPYDVIDESTKRELLSRNDCNVVAIDLPHLPVKTVGPDQVYEQAGRTFARWLDEGVLVRRKHPAMFVYQQTFKVSGKRYRRRGLMANVRVQPFGPSPIGRGGVFPHEQTFSGPKEDRLKLMRATRAQLSPILGLYADPNKSMIQLLASVADHDPTSMYGTTSTDGVLHELWEIDDPDRIRDFIDAMADRDVFIADGHHRYTTALNYRRELIEQQGALVDDHPANFCMFVLVAMQDPGMVVLATHRVLGGMENFTMASLAKAAEGQLKLEPFDGDLAALAEALSKHGPHAMGLFDPRAQTPAAIATTVEPDPLAGVFPDKSDAWRQLDVAIVQHLLVERICEPAFCPTGQHVTWRFPHSLEQLRADAASEGFQLGVVLQPTPLEAVQRVSEAGELMPQKSTFFYPKLATGLVINPLH